jgi:hypothetical protein
MVKLWRFGYSGELGLSRSRASMLSIRAWRVAGMDSIGWRVREGTREEQG